MNGVVGFLDCAPKPFPSHVTNQNEKIKNKKCEFSSHHIKKGENDPFAPASTQPLASPIEG